MQVRNFHGWQPALGVLAFGGLATVLAACASGANPGAAAAPTVRAAATAVAPTVQAAATAVAPAAQPTATSVVSTVQALATQAAPAAATASAAATPVQVTNVNLDSQDATVTLQDVGNQAISLSNWSLQVGTARTQLPASLGMQPGQTVRVNTAAGTSTQSDVYLGQDAQPIASELRPGAQITLTNASGTPVTSFVVPNG